LDELLASGFLNLIIAEDDFYNAIDNGDGIAKDAAIKRAREYDLLRK
jgi:hypothetical protein